VTLCSPEYSLVEVSPQQLVLSEPVTLWESLEQVKARIPVPLSAKTG